MFPAPCATHVLIPLFGITSKLAFYHRPKARSLTFRKEIEERERKEKNKQYGESSPASTKSLFIILHGIRFPQRGYAQVACRIDFKAPFKMRQSLSRSVFGFINKSEHVMSIWQFHDLNRVLQKLDCTTAGTPNH